MWKGITAAALLVILVVGGIFAFAAGEYGTSGDPLVSLSYIETVLAPQIRDEADKIIAEKTAELEDSIDAKIDSVSSEIDDKIAGYTSKSADEIVTDAFVQSVADKVAAKTGGSTSSSTFALVTLKAGQTLTAKVG